MSQTLQVLPVVHLLHEIRREGSGRMDDPVARKDGLCAYESCPEYGAMTRVTATARPAHILYCRTHEIAATFHFDIAPDSAA